MTAEVVPFPATADHNSAQFLRIEHRSGAWYVVRSCRCHPGEAVTIGRITPAAAASALRAMLEVSAALDT
jgi:hypothetical protein